MIIVDGNSVAARAFFAVHRKPGMSFRVADFDAAFLRLLMKSIGMAAVPGRVIICLDSDVCWRTKLFPEYKANRAGLKAYFPWDAYKDRLLDLMADMRRATPVAVVLREGYEADDLVAFFARRRMGPAAIVSYDSDMLQLSSPLPVGPWLEIISPDKGVVRPDPDAWTWLQVMTCIGGHDNIPSLTPLKSDGKAMFRFGEKTVRLYCDPLGRLGLSTEFWRKLPQGSELEATFLKGYERNRLLVDLSLSPIHNEELSPSFGPADPAAAVSFFSSHFNIQGVGERQVRALLERV